MPEMEWSDRYELGVAKMDATHREFIELYNAMFNASAETFLDCLDTFIAHTERHFGQENHWMERVDFPFCHQSEHARVLEVMYEVRKLAAEGDRSYADQLVAELPPWFDDHAATMDRALALYIKGAEYDVENDTLPGENTERDAS